MANGAPSRTPEELRAIYDVTEEEFLARQGIVPNGDMLHVLTALGFRATKDALASDEGEAFLGGPLDNPNPAGTNTGWRRHQTGEGGAEMTQEDRDALIAAMEAIAADQGR